MSNMAEVSGLVKNYSRFRLGPVDFEVPKGSIVGLIGQNGAGKTTLIKSMLNLIVADAGSVKIGEYDLSRNEREIKNMVGYVGEQQYYYEDKRVAWLGNFISRFYSSWDGVLFERLLDRFEVAPEKRARELSKGMRVKLSFAIALAHNPKLMLLDEPTSGLDPVIRRELLEELRGFAGLENRSVVISSHITDDIDRLADYVVFLHDGKIVLYSEKDSLLSEWKRIHYIPGSLGDLQQSLVDIKETVFGSSGITKEFSRFADALTPLITKGEIKVENLGLDDILISLVRRY